MTCRVFTYSPNNIYAHDYYSACKKYDDIKSKVIKYEHKTNDRESLEYQNLIEEFRYWDNKVPETSNIAGEYENKLAQKAEEKERAEKEAKEIKKVEKDKQNSSEPIGTKLNYLA